MSITELKLWYVLVEFTKRYAKNKLLNPDNT